MMRFKLSLPTVSVNSTSIVVAIMLGSLVFYGAALLFKKSPSRLMQGITTPQWFATGIAITKMSEDGTPYQQLHAEEMRHFANSQTTEIQHPRVKVYSETEAPWELSAEKGQAVHGSKLEDIDHIDLQQHVLLEKTNPGAPPSKMKTDFLRLFPETKQAHTDSRVDFSQPGHHLSAVGMDADFIKNTIILRKQVASNHEPNTSTSKIPGR